MNMCVPCVNVCECVFQAVLPTPEVGISHVVLYSLDSLQDKVQVLVDPGLGGLEWPWVVMYIC